MHNAAFAALSMTDWFYDKMAIPPDIIGLSLRELRDHEFVGINVTVPHKQAVMRYVRADERAQAVGAARRSPGFTKRTKSTSSFRNAV